MKIRMPLLVLVSAALTAGCDRSAPSGSPAAPAAAPAPAAAAPSASPVRAAGPAAGKIVARYGGETMTAEELVVELQRLPERSRRMMNEEGRRKFVENQILNELLFQEGERQGFAKDPEIERQVNDLRRRLVVQRVVRNLQNVPPITDEQVKAYYEANPERFSTTSIKARHILVKDEAQAKELRAQVVASPDKFAEIAQANSADTASARKGGDLGFFGRGRMVPEFEAVAFSLKVNEVSDVVKTPYGYHVIRVEEIREGTEKPFDQVKEQIRATMRNQELQSRTKEFYDELKNKAGVTIDEVVLAEVVSSLPEAKGGEADRPPMMHGHPPIGAGGPPAAPPAARPMVRPDAAPPADAHAPHGTH